MYCGLAEVRKSQKKIWSTNRKFAKCHICGRCENLKSYLGPQICGFVNCET
jgi:hypothetical protein